MLNICCNISVPTIDIYDPKKEVDELIQFVRKNLNLDVTPYKEDMLEAKYRGRLEFHYLGPGRTEGKGEKMWNCSLTLLDEIKYFYALTLYDSRTGENPLR